MSKTPQARDASSNMAAAALSLIILTCLLPIPVYGAIRPAAEGGDVSAIAAMVGVFAVQAGVLIGIGAFFRALQRRRGDRWQ